MPEEERPNPDALLNSLRREEAARRRGRLKVFLGMCPGVGKTYAMLEAARREQDAGHDLVVGWIETHGRAETEALTRGLPRIAPRALEHRGVTLLEFDLDAVLARRPKVVLVDELAHSNAPGTRHPKRWQDVQELLEAGIDVFTTLNVQHVGSRADIVRQIAGAEVRETVPDSVLDDAVLELVDLPPAELLERLRDGRVYVPERAAAAVEGFFRESNLTALRELALRLVADHVGADTQEFRFRRQEAGPWKTGHRLLVAVGPSPLSEPLIRWARRMADGLRCPWLAVHVSGVRPLSEAAQARLARNLATARELGAELHATTDEDLVRGLLRVARERNVSQIVVGKPSERNWWEWLRGDHFLRRLARESGNIDLHVVRAESGGAPDGAGAGRAEAGAPAGGTAPRVWDSAPGQYLAALGVVGLAVILNLGLMRLAGPRVPGLVFLLVVVLLALGVGRGPVLVAGAVSAVVWNYFFLPPRFTLTIERPEDAVLFGAYFVVSVVLGQLVARIRAQERAERRREERATALYGLTRELAEATSRDAVVWHLVEQAGRVFRATVAVALPVDDRLVAHPDSTLELSEKELGVSDWAFRRRQAAGRFTDNLPGAVALHVPLAAGSKVLGVLAVNLPDASLTLVQRDLLDAFARQAALVLDRVELRTAAEQARLLAESERLSRALLNSISHELRTPLAASSSAASALAAAEGAPPAQRRALLDELQTANARLNRVVGNLLDVARLEAGNVRPQLDWHDVRDLVQTTLRELNAELASHPVRSELPAEPLLVRMDFTLLQHALANLLLNAVTHTPAGTPVEVQVRCVEGGWTASVADQGPGLPPEVLPRIFEKFYRGPGARAGGSGLGLTIARGFVEAHGGSLTVEARPGGGARFTMRVPQRESPPSWEPGV